MSDQKIAALETALGVENERFMRTSAQLGIAWQERDQARARIKELEHWLECERGRADDACAELRSETMHMQARIKELEAENECLQERLDHIESIGQDI